MSEERLASAGGPMLKGFEDPGLDAFAVEPAYEYPESVKFRSQISVSVTMQHTRAGGVLGGRRLEVDTWWELSSRVVSVGREGRREGRREGEKRRHLCVFFFLAHAVMRPL